MGIAANLLIHLEKIKKMMTCDLYSSRFNFAKSMPDSLQLDIQRADEKLQSAKQHFAQFQKYIKNFSYSFYEPRLKSFVLFWKLQPQYRKPPIISHYPSKDPAGIKKSFRHLEQDVKQAENELNALLELFDFYKKNKSAYPIIACFEDPRWFQTYQEITNLGSPFYINTLLGLYQTILWHAQPTQFNPFIIQSALDQLIARVTYIEKFSCQASYQLENLAYIEDLLTTCDQYNYACPSNFTVQALQVALQNYLSEPTPENRDKIHGPYHRLYRELSYSHRNSNLWFYFASSLHSTFTASVDLPAVSPDSHTSHATSTKTTSPSSFYSTSSSSMASLSFEAASKRARPQLTIDPTAQESWLPPSLGVSV